MRANGRRDVPFALVVNVELEDAMAIRDAERDGVRAGLALDGRERGADVRVEHGELELHVVDVGVRAPPADLRVVLGDERGESLYIAGRSDDRHIMTASRA